MTRLVGSARDGYRRALPDAVRYPIGRTRRRLLDTWRRARTPFPLPPGALLDRVQMTPWVDEYLRVGRASAEAVAAQLDAVGLLSPGSGTSTRVLDFGCGLGRTLRFLDGPLLDGRSLRLDGCDVDARQVDWTRRAFPHLRILESPLEPPVPYPTGAFDAVYAISIFTHFDRDEQRVWLAEMARLLRPGGVLLLTTMGPRALGNFRELRDLEPVLAAEGFAFRAGGERFNQRGAFQRPEGLARLAPPALEPELWLDGGLDGFQDLHRLRRIESSSAP